MAPDLRGFFANCFIAGETGAAEREGRTYRDTIELSLSGRDVKLIQRPEIVGDNPRNYRHQWVPTTTVVVANVETEEREEIKELLQSLSHLLSFATSSEVAFYRWSYDEKSPRNGGWATVARTGFARPVVDLSSGQSVREYLERSWEGYRRLEQSRKLREAIHLYVLAETRSLPEELKAATIFILLENLKSTYAAERGIPFSNGDFRKQSGKPWKFENLLKEMFKDVGMTQPDLTAVVDLRNEIIHAGVSQMPRAQQEEVYEKCQDLVREYLLRLFGYTGIFRLFSVRGMTLKRI